MALSQSQLALLDRFLKRVRSGNTRPFAADGVEAAVLRGGRTLRLRISGGDARAQANQWVSACAQRAGRADQRPGPDARVIIDITLD